MEFAEAAEESWEANPKFRFLYHMEMELRGVSECDGHL
jgi:hypothetical protein